ncbi:hypothetical protein BC829DRAFT_409288 [Chytridium lagenaria]|nr:hypothetical protein BC829DRAFT_409288 [Chytridium lagenaria]
MSTTTSPDCEILASAFTSFPNNTDCCTINPRAIVCDSERRIVAISLVNTTTPSLVLQNLGLSGPIPDQLQTLTSLTTFSVAQNRISGGIPEWIGRMENLTALHFFTNEMSGPIPEFIYSLTNLRNLSFSTNSFSVNLENGWFFRNNFTGPIPATISNLRNTNLLSFSDNYFGGQPLPESLYTVPGRVTLGNNCFRRGDINLTASNNRFGTNYNSTRTFTQCSSAFTFANLPVPSDLQSTLFTSTSGSAPDVPLTTASPREGNTVNTSGGLSFILLVTLGPVIGIILVATVATIIVKRRKGAVKMAGRV